MSIAAQDETPGACAGRAIRSEAQIDAIRRHVDELSQGAAFKGSHRSQQFLRYIIEKTLAGSVEGVKERTIGVELFQKSPTYDTGQDAIVRVTASDVRRRLLQHYGRYGDASAFQIHLPPGSYLPEIEVYSELAVPEKESASGEEAGKAASGDENRLVAESEVASFQSYIHIIWARWWLWGAVAGALLMALAVFVGYRLIAAKPTAALPPWSVILRSGHGTQVITSDPNVEELQELTGRNISVSDYANHRYIPDEDTLSAQQKQFYSYYQHADNAAAVDMPLVVSIARLVPPDFPIRIRSARSLHIADLQSDDNLILIGSPRSNPWVGIFEDQLDFRLVFHPELNQEIIENLHPKSGEQVRYLPTARGFATGESFALVALVHNQDHSGRVLLLAGASGEGTEAAGRMVTDREHLLRLLSDCGVPTAGPIPDFELLLQLRTLAGSPGTVDMIACHVFADRKFR